MIWTISTSRVFVIADTVVLLYGYNATMVWRVGMYQVKNATFNLRNHINIPSNTIDYPCFANNMLVLGTLNTSSMATGNPQFSTIYAFSATDLSVQWTSTVHYGRTNYPMVWLNNSMRLWTAARSESGNVHMLGIWVANGTVNVDINTQTSDYVRFNQFGRVLALMSRDDYVLFYATNGTQLYSYSTDTCYNVRFSPGLLNTTWFAQCDGNVFMFSMNPIAYVGQVSLEDDITAAAAQTNNMDVLLFASNYVYKINATRQHQKMITFNLTQQNSIKPVAAFFAPLWMYLGLPNTTCHVSYTGGNGGSVIGYDYVSNRVIGQITGRLTPVGRAFLYPYTSDGWMTWRWRVMVASANTEFVQGYDYVQTNVTFVTEIDSSDSFTDYPSVVEHNSSVTYVFTRSVMYMVDPHGNVIGQSTLPTSYLTTIVPPFVVGTSVCAIQSYYDDSAEVYCYSIPATTWKTFTMCQPLQGTLPYVWYNTMMISCSTYFNSAVAVADVTGTSATVYTGNSDYRSEAVLIGNFAVAQTASATLSAFDISSTSSSAAWTITSASWTSVQSNVVSDGTHLYVVGYPKYTAGNINTHEVLFKISTTGFIVDQMYLPFYADVVRLRLRTGPNFGPVGVVYMFGTNNITAVDLSSFTTMFWVNTNTSILTTSLGGGTVLRSGAVCFYGSNNYFYVYSGFNGALAWRHRLYTSSKVVCRSLGPTRACTSAPGASSSRPTRTPVPSTVRWATATSSCRSRTALRGARGRRRPSSPPATTWWLRPASTTTRSRRLDSAAASQRTVATLAPPPWTTRRRSSSLSSSLLSSS